MKKIISIYFSLICSCCLVSQEININKLDYVVTKNNKNFIFFNESQEYTVNTNGIVIDSVIENKIINPTNYFPVFNGDFQLFIERQGGKVYQKLNQKLKRIDNSYTHKNQLLSSIFLRNDTIFRFGGYGFFEAKNYFTYFSNKTKEWEALEIKSNVFPVGNFDNKYFLTSNYFYFLGGNSIDQKNKNKKFLNKELWRFSFYNSTWELILTNEFFIDKNYSPFDFLYKNDFFFIDENKLFSYNINSNSINKYIDSKVLDKGNYRFPSILKNDTLFTIGLSSNTKYNIFPVPLSSLKIEKTIVQKSKSIFYFIFLILVLIVFTFLHFYKKNWFRKKIKLKGNTLSYGFKSIELSDLELTFINILINGKDIENVFLINSIDSNIDSSQKTRIKNQIIYGLNIRLEILTKNRFTITKKASKNDKRYFYYSLKKI